MIEKSSPAKINLFLKVLGKRPDGYHELATLMQKIDLSDRISFLAGGKGIQVECPDSDLPGGEANIAFKAARALFSYVSDDPGIRILIKKSIPVAAGLGGGSSNAATVLSTLNEIFGYRLSRDELLGIGEKIGADVPFFLGDSAAWALGKGERLVEAVNFPSLWFVLVNPRFEVSTKMVYEGLKMDSKIQLTNNALQFNIPKFFSLQELIYGLRNDLEQVTLKLHPVLADLKKSLLHHGALGSLMSGSGPTVFGIFREKQDAMQAAEELGRKGPWLVFAAHSLNN